MHSYLRFTCAGSGGGVGGQAAGGATGESTAGAAEQPSGECAARLRETVRTARRAADVNNSQGIPNTLQAFKPIDGC